MKKSKSGERKPQPARKEFKFSIGPDSPPRKVQRWLSRGGGVAIVNSPAEIAAAHIHPRHLRYASGPSD